MPGRKLTVTSLSHKPKLKHRKQHRSLHALAIAEQQSAAPLRSGANPLNEVRDGLLKHKRKRPLESAESNDVSGKPKKHGLRNMERRRNEVDDGNTSNGNSSALDQIDSDQDSEIDSEEAMGESDEDRFEGFAFRGSSAAKSDQTLRSTAKAVGSQSNDRQAGRSDEEKDEEGLLEGDSAELGDDSIDLATLLDVDNNNAPILAANPMSMASTLDELQATSKEHLNAGFISTEEDTSMFSGSDAEDDMADPTKLASFQEFVAGIDEQTHHTPQSHAVSNDHQEFKTPSDFGLASTRKLRVTDLLPSVTDPQLKKSLKLLTEKKNAKSSSRSGIPGKLDVPLPRREQDRLDRVAANEKSKESLNRWVDTVKHNRRAEHLFFPLKDPDRLPPQGTNKLLTEIHSKPLTELENVVQKIMQESGFGSTKPISDEEEGGLTATDNLPSNKVSFQDILAKRAELRRARDVLFREMTRSKRIKKIKSKNYRRVHRQQREVNPQLEEDFLAVLGDDDSQVERQQRRRAEERMGARYRGSKWADGVKSSGRTIWDEDARGGMVEMARREEELRKRIKGQRVSDEDGSEISESDSDSDTELESDPSKQIRSQKLQNQLDSLSRTEKNSTKSKLSSMNFMKKADALRKKANDAEISLLQKELAGKETSEREDAANNVGRRFYGPTKQMERSTEAQTREVLNEFEEKQLSDASDGELSFIVDNAEQEMTSDVLKVTQGLRPGRSIKAHHHSGKTSEYVKNDLENPWLSTSNQRKVKRTSRDNDGVAIISNDADVNQLAIKLKEKSNLPKPLANGRKSAQKLEIRTEITSDGISSDSEEDEMIQMPSLLPNQELIRQAFAGDDVVADFEKEKEETVHQEEEKLIDDTLPGWGNWTGSGVSNKAQKHRKDKILVKTDGVRREKRQDATLDRVIINEKKVKKVSGIRPSRLFGSPSC